MEYFKWREWAWQYVLPFVILAGGALLTILIGEFLLGGVDLDILYFLVIVPVLALVIGLVMKPAHIWIVPALIVIAALITAAVSQGVGRAAEITPNFIFLVGAPLALLIWLGKALRPRVIDILGRANKPNVPST